MFYGTNVDPKVKKPVDFETELKHVFGGGPLKLTGQLSVKSVDLKTKLADIHVEQEAEKQSFIQLLIKGYAGRAKDLFEDVKNGSMRDEIDVTISLDSGLATHAKRVRTTVGANTVQIDEVELTLQK